MKRQQKYTFESKLERISQEMNYFAISVPAKITKALATRGPVPVSARFNGSEEFFVSLFPVGGGRHYIRIKAKIREVAKLKEGSRVRVQFTLVDRVAELSIPKDLTAALREEGVMEAFNALPIGKKTFMIRKIDDAAKAETRARRIQDAVDEAHEKREKSIHRNSNS
jgi:hypothetical protein